MGPELAVARDELRGELDNLRAAVEWILAEDDEHAALAVLEAFYTFLWMHSWFEGAETLERLARTAGFDADDPGSASAVALAAAMYRIAIGARLGYDPAAEELAARCLPVLRARNLERELARCLCALGIMAVYRDVFPEAVAFLEEGTEIARATGDRLTESGALMDLGFARLLMDDLEAAREAFEAAHVLCREARQPASARVRHEQARPPRRCRGALRRRASAAHGGERPVRVRRRRRRDRATRSAARA